MDQPPDRSSGVPASESSRFSLRRFLGWTTPEESPETSENNVPSAKEPSAGIVSQPPDHLMPPPSDHPAKKTKSGSQTRRRTKGIYVACTPEEYVAVQERASRAGLSTSAYLRTCGLGDAGPRAQRRPPVERQMLAQVLGQLGKMEGDIRQMTQRLPVNEGTNRADMDAALAAFRAAATVVMQALGKRPPVSGHGGAHDY